MERAAMKINARPPRPKPPKPPKASPADEDDSAAPPEKVELGPR